RPSSLVTRARSWSVASWPSMKVTGSPTKRNSENAIRPTMSMTRTAWPSRLRTNASMRPLESVCVEIRKHPGRLAEAAWPARLALAGHARPLPHLAVGGDAAADPGERGHSLLRALPAPFCLRRGARPCFGRRGAAAMERAWLLRSRKESSCRCESRCRSGFFSANGGSNRNAPRDRKVHGGRHRGVRVWRARRDPRRQREAGARAPLRHRGLARREIGRVPAMGAGAGGASDERHRNLYPGADGSGRDGMQEKRTALRPLPGAHRVLGEEDQAYGADPGAAAAQGAAAEGGHVAAAFRSWTGASGEAPGTGHLGRPVVISGGAGEGRRGPLSPRPRM